MSNASHHPWYFKGFHVPPHMVDHLHDYVQHGAPQGDFLRGCIENNLRDACAQADGENIGQLPAFIGFLVQEVPAPAWGSPAKYLKWVAHKGLDGAADMPHMDETVAHGKRHGGKS